MYPGILSTIGGTPLIRLENLYPDSHFKLYAKLEAFNPGGSIKDRAAITILQKAIDDGDITPRTTIIESSSGNMGIGLAQSCAYLGLRFICVVDVKTTKQNIKILEAYGAEIDLVSIPSARTGEFLDARLERVKELRRSIANSFWPNQYSNLNNALAHRKTMDEVITELGEIDYLFCAASTCGTLRGCADFVREQKLKTKIFAVDAVGSAIFGGQKPSKRLIPGHGASVTPDLYQSNLAHRCVHLTDLECILGCRRLIQQEAILAGGSSGAVVMAVEQVKDEIERNATCVLIFPDRGERYLDTIYSDEWVNHHFGDVSQLLNPALESEPCMVGAS